MQPGDFGLDLGGAQGVGGVERGGLSGLQLVQQHFGFLDALGQLQRLELVLGALANRGQRLRRASICVRRSWTSASIASTLSRLESPYMLNVTSLLCCSRQMRRCSSSAASRAVTSASSKRKRAMVTSIFFSAGAGCGRERSSHAA